MRTTIITPPAVAPVTWDMVRTHLRLDELDPEVVDSEQTYCMDLAASAARVATSVTRCALIETQYEADLFPGEMSHRPDTGFRNCGCTGRPPILELDFPPLISVDSIVLGEGTDATPLTEGTDYWILQTADGKPTMPGTILFRSGLFDPACCCSCACYDLTQNWSSLHVLYTAGYGTDPQDVPADIRHWILLRTGAGYEYREESAEVRNIVTMPWADSLLTSERWFEFV